MFADRTDPYIGEVSQNFGLVLKLWRVMGTITRRPAKFSDLSWWAGLWSPVAIKRVRADVHLSIADTEADFLSMYQFSIVLTF